MKRILLAILSIMLVLCVALTYGCNKKEQWGIPTLPNTDEQVLTLSTGTKTLIIGESFALKVFGITDAIPEFNSNNESVATVNQNGLVAAVGVGEATIKVTVAGRQSKNCYIKVIEDTRIPILRFNNVAKENGKYVLPLGAGEEYALDYDIIFGGTFVEGTVLFESLDENVASVDAKGVVTAGNVEGNGVETIIKVNAEYNGKYSEDLYTEITVLVTDAKWSFALDSEDSLYAVDSFDSEQYKNTVGFIASLTVGGQTVNESEIAVTCEDGRFEINGNVITAKKAGLGYVKLAYENGEDVYERLVPINVERVVDDRTTANAEIFVRREGTVSISRFNEFADNRETEKVFVYGDSFKTELKVENGKFVGLDNGINYVEIQNDILSVKLQMHFVDYYFGEIDSLLYQYTLDENGDGDIENQSIVLPNSFDEESVRYFAIYRADGASQKFAIESYDKATRTLTIAKTWRDAYWFWYTGDVYFTVVTDSTYYMGEITVKNATREPEINVTNRTYYAGELFNGEVAYLERYSDAPEEQSFVLPESFGNVINFKIAGIVDTVYSATDRTITVNKADIQNLNNGVKIAVFENENGQCYCNLTIAEYVIRSAEEISKLADTNSNYYIVIADDIDASASGGITPNTWQTTYSGTIDGKGHIVSNLSITGHAWWGLIYNQFKGTIKDIAFVNLQNTGGAGNGFISQNAIGATLENVYISGNSKACNTLFQTVESQGVNLNNVVLNFASNSGEEGVVATDMTNVTLNNVVTLNDEYFSANVGAKFGMFEVKADGVYFNGKFVGLPSKVDLTERLVGGVLGVVGSNSNRDVQEIKLPYQILGIEKVASIDFDIWGSGTQYRSLAVTYNAENNSFNVTKSAVNAVLSDAYSGAITRTCKIVTEDSTYWAEIQLLGINAPLNFISTKAELESYLTAENFVAGQHYVLTNDIDGAVIENKSNKSNGIVAHFDGRGYQLTNLTIKGYGLLGNYFNGTFKNTVIKVIAVETETKGLISGQSANCNMSNIYVEGNVTGSKAEHIFRGVYSGCVFGNIVVNVKGIVGVIASDTATQNNVITVTESFFTDNANLSFGSFAMTDAGLTFNGRLVLVK